jgi:hypothetical protein
MVLLASAFDQSKYLSAADLSQEMKLRIKTVTVETVRGQGSAQEQKPIVWFTNHKKGLVLNKTNNRTLRGTFGDDMEQWAGKIVILFPTHTDFGGRTVGALRIRIPPPKQATTGNGQPAEVKETLDKFAAPPEPKPEPKPTLSDDLDDEIGF